VLCFCIAQHFHQAPPLLGIVKSHFKIRYADTVNRPCQNKRMAPQYVVQSLNLSPARISGTECKGVGLGPRVWREFEGISTAPYFALIHSKRKRQRLLNFSSRSVIPITDLTSSSYIGLRLFKYACQLYYSYRCF